MALNEEQLAAVRQWVEDGAGLNDVQRRIQEEFGVTMTYMDVRFLVLDIGATVKDKEPPKPVEPEPEMVASEQERPTLQEEARFGANEEQSIAPEDDEPKMPTRVSVTLDKVVRAGAMMSGTVTFSDGVVGSWMLDRMGRLALTKISQPGYQPSDIDLEAFQLELQAKLQAGAY